MPDMTQEEIHAMQLKWKMLAIHLREVSKTICAENGCTENDHKCESYAYVNIKGDLLDVCLPDYFSGSVNGYAVVPLPWNGDGDDLMDMVEREIEDVEENGGEDVKIII